MKKVLLVFAVALTFALASCNKEKTCECTVKTTTEGMDPITATTEFVTEEECSDGNSTTTMMGTSVVTTCVEK